MKIVAVVLVGAVALSGCVATIADPVGDGSGELDIVEAGVDYRRQQARFWVELAEAPAAEDFTVLWCFDPNEAVECSRTDPSSTPRVKLGTADLRWFVDVGRSGTTCDGSGAFDGGRTWSVTLDPSCLSSVEPGGAFRFRAVVYRGGYDDLDDDLDFTEQAPTAVVSDD